MKISNIEETQEDLEYLVEAIKNTRNAGRIEYLLASISFEKQTKVILNTEITFSQSFGKIYTVE